MMEPEKFAFDTEFDENGEILREGEAYKRFYTADDVEAARMWGVEEGRMGEEGRAADALEAIGAQMRLILARLAGESEQLRQEATRLSLAAARKIGGAALDRFPADTVMQIADEALRDLRAEPRFSVRCAPELVETLAEQLEEAASSIGFEGRVHVRGEQGLQGADCRLEWGGGAIERSSEEIETRLVEIVERWLASAAEEEPTDAGESGAGVSAA